MYSVHTHTRGVGGKEGDSDYKWLQKCVVFIRDFNITSLGHCNRQHHVGTFPKAKRMIPKKASINT